MLVVKLIEAAMRISGGIGFDYSNHVIDSGLLGVCGLLGCCGPRQRRSHRRRFRATEVPPSQVSSFSPPNDVGAGKTHSGPPSVLRPEHAMQPYREDSDDEDGYIMGAWQPFPGPGYNSVTEPSSPVQQPTSQSSTGFSRVGGGRAHFDSPYAIASGSTQTFPSVGRNSFTSSPLAVFRDDDSPRPSLTQDAHFLSGPTPSTHVRTKSQTAIVENSPTVFHNLSPRRTSEHADRRNSDKYSHPAALTFQDEDDSDLGHPKKKHWYQLRRARPRSEGSSLPVMDSSLISPSPDSEPGRSFVVIRARKPQGLPSNVPHSPDPNTPEFPPVDPSVSHERHSFTVDNRGSGDPRGWNVTT